MRTINISEFRVKIFTLIVDSMTKLEQMDTHNVADFQGIAMLCQVHQAACREYATYHNETVAGKMSNHVKDALETLAQLGQSDEEDIMAVSSAMNHLQDALAEVHQ